MPAKAFGGLHAKPNDSESPISWGPEDGSYAGLLPIPCQRYENGERQGRIAKCPAWTLHKVHGLEEPWGGGRWIFVDPEKCRICGKTDRRREGLPLPGTAGQTRLMNGADETDKRTVSVCTKTACVTDCSLPLFLSAYTNRGQEHGQRRS